MAVAVNAEMKAYAENQRKLGNSKVNQPATDWEDMEENVDKFIKGSENPEKRNLVPEVTREYIGEKIKMLDKNYILDEDDAMLFPKAKTPCPHSTTNDIPQKPIGF